jgi:hypothetical protein
VPHKGIFTAGACVLLREVVPLSVVARLVGGVAPLLDQEPAAESWHFGGRSLAVSTGQQPTARLLIDVVPQSWPDAMGDPVGDPKLFQAWGLGHFGPTTWPGSLDRARRSPWVERAAAMGAADHAAFVRLRATQSAGVAGDDPLISQEYDPLAELYMVTKVAMALSDLPGALCYFNPNGESLATFANLQSSRQRGHCGGPMPLEVWSSRRLFAWAELPGWNLVDTVGVSQLDGFPSKSWCLDHEACFTTGRYSPNEISLFLLNTAHVLVTTKRQLADGATTDGPGGLWKMHFYEESLEMPPRNVVRWLPVDGPAPPPRFLGVPTRKTSKPTQEPRRRWGLFGRS